MSEMCIQVTDLKKYYPHSGYGTLKAVDGVSLGIRRGSIFGIVGESGCGKSTLGKCMMRLTNITDGHVIFNGADISRQPRGKILNELKRMQMIFQNPYSSFNPKLKLSYSIREACRLRGMSNAVIAEKTERYLGLISLSQDELSRFPHELSGGQLQRLAIIRALLLEPDFIMADEPVSALDVSVQAQILNLIDDLRSVFSMTMMFISHDITVVEHLCDDMAVMYLGSIVEMGKASTLLSNVLHPYTQALVSAIPVICESKDENKRIVLTGDIPTAVNIPEGCRFASRCPRCMEVCKHENPEFKQIEDAHLVACHLYS